MLTFLGHNSTLSSGITRQRLLAAPMLFAAAICSMQMLPAQTPAPPPPLQATAHTATRHHQHPAPAPAQRTPPPAALLPPTPPAPEMPLWPANEKPFGAAVVWDSQGLQINAANSSLHQILTDVAAATGATVEGLGADERIFGVYGPGKARDVISQLLQGTTYNVLLIGDQGEGTPRDIILSSRHPGTAPALAGNTPPSNEEDEVADDPPPPSNPPPLRNGFPPGGQRSPQQMQEMQQRQEQMQRGQPMQPPQ